ncbi:hypothetical protein JNUCC0626_20135 [Lentzea sp. JNUCC 0626]|uniref:hypothetical protein n=1 Tax=Lentzea sp. JNUCC 0626 TaxID=3367513 RepID=UPI0037499E1A
MSAQPEATGNLDAPADNGLAIDLAEAVAAQTNLRDCQDAQRRAVERRRNAVRRLHEVHGMKWEVVGRHLQLSPGSVHRAVFPRTKGSPTELDPQDVPDVADEAEHGHRDE